MQTIIVTIEIDVPDNATNKDITDFVDVEYGHVNGMKLDNPCQGDACEIIEATWKSAHSATGRSTHVGVSHEKTSA